MLDLFGAVYGAGWRDRTCVDRYVGNSAPTASVSVDEQDGTIVGAQPSFDLPLWVAGADATATTLVDVVTHPSYRRQGIFAALVDHAVRLAGERGAAVVLTTPNRISYPGFRKKSSWRLLATLECWVRPLRTEGLLRGALGLPRPLASGLAIPFRPFLDWLPRRQPGTTASGSPAWPDDRALEGLWNRCAPVAGIVIRRDPAWFRWRFSPGAGSRYACIEKNLEDGRLSGYAVTTLRQVGRLGVAFLVDALCHPDDARAPARLIEGVCDWGLAHGAAIAAVYCIPGSRWSVAARGCGFWRLPARLTRRPYRVCASLGPVASGGRLLDPGAWQLSAADSDLL